MTNTTAVRPRIASRWKVFGATFAVLGILMSLWALASPLNSVPDEPSHVVRAAAAARGEFVAGSSAKVPWEMGVEVPRYYQLTQETQCFGFKPEVTPDECVIPDQGSPSEIVEGRTSAALNNPLYYVLVGWPSLLGANDAGYYGMRIVNALLCAFLGGIAAMGIAQFASRFTKLALAVSITPMVLFLGGAVNPNGVEILATVAVFATLLTLVRTPSPPRLLWERSTLLSISTVLLITTRSIALLWLALVVVAALILADRALLAPLFKRLALWVAVAVGAAAGVFQLWWLLHPPVLPPGPAYEGKGSVFHLGFETMLDRTFPYLSEWIGLFGWVDRPAPGFAVAIWCTLITIIVVGALAVGAGRERLTLILALVAVVFIPPIAQAAVVTDIGYIWQGRYFVAVYATTLIVAGLTLDTRFAKRLSKPGEALTRRMFTWAVWLMVAAQAFTFVWVLRRYVIGTGSWVSMITAAEWQPPLGWMALSVLFAAATAGSGLLLQRWLRAPRILPNDRAVRG